MKDDIKIAYSWIGPRGPIPNTDLPNIINFSSVAEGAKNTSERLFSDDVFWKIFLNNEPYSLGSVYDLSGEQIFLYPFQLNWRTTFFNYFYPRDGILEFSHTQGHIIDRVRHGNGYFLLEMAAEAFIRDEHLTLIHGYFSSYNIPMHKILYLTGCMNAVDVYEDWCIQKNIPNDPYHRMRLISYPTARYHLGHRIHETPEPDYDTEVAPEKLFLCWNRRFRLHRSILNVALDKLGLVDRSYYSMGVVDPEFQSQRFIDTLPSDDNNGVLNFFGCTDEVNSLYDITTEDVSRLTAKLPLVIDGETEIGEMCQDTFGKARSFYQNSLVSIVTETNWDIPHLTSTEKSFKPFKEKHPFIIVGVNGALKSMRELGFKTFSDYWDESYDEIKNPHMRLLKIIEVCKYIGSWDTNKIIEFRRSVKTILDHNYFALRDSSTKEIADIISKIVRKEQ